MRRQQLQDALEGKPPPQGWGSREGPRGARGGEAVAPSIGRIGSTVPTARRFLIQCVATTYLAFFADASLRKKKKTLRACALGENRTKRNRFY